MNRGKKEWNGDGRRRLTRIAYPLNNYLSASPLRRCPDKRSLKQMCFQVHKLGNGVERSITQIAHKFLKHWFPSSQTAILKTKIIIVEIPRRNFQQTTITISIQINIHSLIIILVLQTHLLLAKAFAFQNTFAESMIQESSEVMNLTQKYK